MDRKPLNLPWWGKAERQIPTTRVELEREIRSRRRNLQLEALEERNLLTGMSLGEAIARLFAISPNPSATTTSTTQTATTSSSSTSPLDAVDPNSIPITVDSGEATFAINASVYLPTATYVQGPSGITAPGATYTPSSAGIAFSGTVQTNAPLISEWTRTAGIDDSISLSGVSFSTLASSPTKFYVFTDTGNGNGKITMINTQSLSGSSAVVTLPSTDVPANAMYMLWAVDSDGTSRPVFVNQTETWWVGPNAAQAGQSIAVYGRNLSQTGAEWVKGVSAGTAPTWVWIQPDAGGPAQQVTVNNTNPYRVEFQLPSTLAAGTYTVWVHNGLGGDYGWGAPLKFTVRSAAQNGNQWTGLTYTSGNNSFLAAMVTNAAGADDGAYLQSLLNQAAKSTTGGVTIVLPAGTFWIANPLQIPSNVRLRGAGMDQTILKAIPGAAFQSMGIVYSYKGTFTQGNLAFEDLTFNSGYNPLGASDPLYTGGIDDLLRLFSLTDVRFTRVRFDTKSAEAFQINQGTRITIDSCDFRSQTGAFFIDCEQVQVINSNFTVTNLGSQAIHSSGTNSLSIIGNTCSSESTANTSRSAQWGLRFFVNQQGGWLQYLGKNNISNLGLPPSVNLNDGEQILWEGPGPQYAGSPVSVSGSVLTFASTTAGVDFGSGHFFAVVIKGTGVGQTRRIVGQTTVGNGMSVTLDSAFTNPVDQTSVVQFLMLADKVAVYSNKLSSLVENVNRDAFIGQAGIMTFGGSSNFMIDSNTLTNIRLGISIWSLTSQTAAGQYETANYNIVMNNVISNARFAMMLETAGGSPSNVDAGARDRRTMVGNVFRDNKVTNAVESAFDVAFIPNSMSYTVDQTIENLIVEHNAFIGTQVGINLAEATRIDYRALGTSAAILKNSLIYKNTIQQNASSSATPLAGSKGIILGDGQSPSLVGNTVTGFDVAYANSTPIIVKATSTPNTYTFTLTPRDLDRKGGMFNYWIDWNNDGWTDQITPGVYQVVGGRVITFTYTFPQAGPTQTKITIGQLGDSFGYTYVIDLNVGSGYNNDAPLVDTAIVAAPTANSLEYSFSLFANSMGANSNKYYAFFDWNNDGVYDEGRYINTSDVFTRRFSSSQPTTFTCMVFDEAGNRSVRSFTIDPSSRNLYFLGSNREDFVAFTEKSTGVVQVDLTRIAGRELSSVKNIVYSGISGVMAQGFDGPDYINASGLTSRAATIYGGAGSDTIMGGAQNDFLYGGGPSGSMRVDDAPNVIIGVNGADTIWTGNTYDTVLASASSIFGSLSDSMYIMSGLGITKIGIQVTTSSDSTSSLSFSSTNLKPIAASTLLNIVGGTATSFAALSQRDSSSSTATASVSKSSSSSTSSKTSGTPAITTASRTSTGTGASVVNSDEVQLPAESVDDVVLDWDLHDDEESLIHYLTTE